MSTRLVNTDIVIGIDEDNNPIYKKIPASDRLSIIKQKLNNMLSDGNDFVRDSMVLKTTRLCLLEGLDVDSITPTVLASKRPYNNVIRYTDYDSYLGIFIKNKIGSFLNISFDDFISKTLIEIDRIIDLTEKAVAEANSSENINNKAMMDEIKKLGGMFNG